MKKVLVLAVVISIFLVGCGNKINGDKIYKEISQEDTHEFVNNGNAVLIDIRKYEDYSLGHIENSVNVPLGEISKESIEMVVMDKLENIIVYGGTSKESKEAAIKILELGYINTYDLGTIGKWTMSELIRLQ